MICWWLKWVEQDNMLARIGSHTFGGGWFWGWFWHDLSIHQSSILSHQSSIINHQSSIINHPSIIHSSSNISHQSSIMHPSSINHQASVIDHQSSIINHQPSNIWEGQEKSKKIGKSKSIWKPSGTIGNLRKSLRTLRKPSESLRNPWKPLETFENLQTNVEKLSFGTKFVKFWSPKL